MKCLAISHFSIADDHPIFIVTPLAMFSRLPYHHPHADAYSWDLDQGYSCPDVLWIECWPWECEGSQVAVSHMMLDPTAYLAWGI